MYNVHTQDIYNDYINIILQLGIVIFRELEK